MMILQCQHFRDHFVDFAKQVNAVTEEAGSESIQFHAISCVAHKSICQGACVVSILHQRSKVFLP